MSAELNPPGPKVREADGDLREGRGLLPHASEGAHRAMRACVHSKLTHDRATAPASTEERGGSHLPGRGTL